MEKNTRLKFFGIGRIIPYLGGVKKMMLAMVLLALVSSITDILVPLYQRYALDEFVGTGSFRTLIPFLIAYILTILIASGVNYIS